MLRNVHQTWGIVLIVASSLALIAVIVLARGLVFGVAGGLVLAAGGAGVGVGALLVQHDVTPPAWLLAPVLVAVCSVLNARGLLGGDGPLRT
jgi:hypothetical protein